ncbi:hypothetical protein V5799_020364 [Amblyomma americanum]|uniref:Uncharacterized protein n=1 Tax=Amblyomma americanum TaxID=6943 RepID=A0AAQ4EU90_AMBAM
MISSSSRSLLSASSSGTSSIRGRSHPRTSTMNNGMASAGDPDLVAGPDLQAIEPWRTQWTTTSYWILTMVILCITSSLAITATYLAKTSDNEVTDDDLPGRIPRGLLRRSERGTQLARNLSVNLNSVPQPLHQSGSAWSDRPPRSPRSFSAATFLRRTLKHPPLLKPTIKPTRSHSISQSNFIPSGIANFTLSAGTNGAASKASQSSSSCPGTESSDAAAVSGASSPGSSLQYSKGSELSSHEGFSLTSAPRESFSGKKAGNKSKRKRNFFSRKLT